MKQFGARVRLGASMILIVLSALVGTILCAETGATCWAVRLVSTMGPRFGGDITVAVWAGGLESPDAAGARAAEVIAETPGVTRVTTLEPARTDLWLGALMGGNRVGKTAPRLLMVGTLRKGWASPSNVAGRLRKDGFDAAAEGHVGGVGHTATMYEICALGAGALTLMLLAVFFLACFMMGQGAIARDERRAALMIRLGARPSLIGALETRRLGWFILAGGLGAALGGALLILDASIFAWPAIAPLIMRDGIGLVLWPIFLFVLGSAGARLGAQRRLKDIEMRK